LVRNLHPGRATKEVLRSHVYAFEGLLYTLHTQRNMRFHIFFAILVITWYVAFQIPVMERALLLIVVCLVPAFEIINTSLESQADYVGQEAHVLIKRAKDTAAGAVLVIALLAMAMGGYILLPPLIDFFRQPTTERITALGIRMLFSTLILGSLLSFWALRSVRHLFFPMLALASLVIGVSIAALCRLGHDASAFVALSFLCALELNAFARSEFEIRIRKAWVRKDLPFEIQGFKIILPGMLLGLIAGLWVSRDFVRRILGY